MLQFLPPAAHDRFARLKLLSSLTLYDLIWVMDEKQHMFEYLVENYVSLGENVHEEYANNSCRSLKQLTSQINSLYSGSSLQCPG